MRDSIILYFLILTLQAMQLNIYFNTSASVWHKSAIAVFELLQFKPNRFEIDYNSSPNTINPVSGKPSSFKTKKGKVKDLNLLFKEIDFLTQSLTLIREDETVFVTYNILRKLNSIDVTQELFNYLKNDINALGFVYHNHEDNPSLFDARFLYYHPFFLFKPAYIICLFPALLNILPSLNTKEIAKISYDYKESNGSHYFKLFKQPDLISNKDAIHFLMFFTYTSTKRSINLPTQLKFIEIISAASVVSEFNQWLHVSQLRWQEMYTTSNNDLVNCYWVDGQGIATYKFNAVYSIVFPLNRGSKLKEWYLFKNGEEEGFLKNLKRDL